MDLYSVLNTGDQTHKPHDTVSGRPIFRYAVRVIKIVLLLTVLLFVSIALYRALLNFDRSMLVFHLLWFSSGTLILVGSHIVGAWCYQCLYRGLSSDLTWNQAFILLTVPSLGKYLPGKVLALAGHAAIANSFGVPIGLSGMAIVLITGLSLAATFLIGLVLMLTQTPLQAINQFHQVDLTTAFFILLLLLFHPRIFYGAVNYILRLLSRPPLTARLNLQTMVKLFIGLLLQNCLYTSGASLIIFGVLELPITSLFLIIGASCLANVAGFVAIFAPGGIGVREAALLLLLTPTVGAGNAAMITLLARLLQTVIDAFFAVPGFAALYLLRRNADHPP